MKFQKIGMEKVEFSSFCTCVCVHIYGLIKIFVSYEGLKVSSYSCRWWFNILGKRKSKRE